MHIRPAQLLDAEEWVRLRLALWDNADPAETMDEVMRFFANPGDKTLPYLDAVFVCPRPDGGLCGMAEVSIRTSAPSCETDRIGYLEAWYVDADSRRRGVGRALVEQVESWARAKGCQEMASDTTPSYPVSPAAHAALGFEETERYFRKLLT